MLAHVIAVLALVSILCLPSLALAQCEFWIQGPMDDGTLPNGANGNIYASINWDPDGAGPIQERLVVAGDFTSIAGQSALHIAQYDPSTASWQPFGTGIPPSVYSLAVFNGQVIAGCDGDNNVGTFDQTVRRWTGSAWESLSATNTGDVDEMIVYNGNLYIAGTFVTHFVTQGSDPAHYIARWNAAANLWDDVEEANFGTQTNTAVRALEIYNGELFAAGNKPSIGSITGNAIHISHGTGPALWTTITDGTSAGGIYDLGVFSGELLIGGGFLDINGVTCRNFAGWNGSTFRAFDNGVSSPSGVGSTIWSIAIHNGIVIGGDFVTAGSVTANRVAFWAPGGFAWQTVGTGTNDRVYDLVSYGNELVAVGNFTTAGGITASHIAHWNGAQWSAFGGGSASSVLAYTNFFGRIVAGGSFQQPTASFGTASNIAAWNGGSLSAFGVGMNSQVFALESFKYPGFNGSYELIAGGIFTTAGGVSALRIARWNESPTGGFPPPAWAPMGAGFNFNVYAIERMGSTTYAGGNFSLSGATAVSRIARWNETTDLWENFGGMNGTVYALKEFDGSLYAGGEFTTAGGISTGGLARWNGASWGSVGGFFSGSVYALEVYDGNLIIGGQFPGLPNGANIAGYSGLSYFNLGSGGVNSVGVRSLKTSGNRLYVGGGFTTAGGVAAENIASWNGSSWSAMTGGGSNNVPWALGSIFGEVHVGGDFTTVSAGALASPRWARYTDTGLPWFALHPSPFSQTVSIGSATTFSAAIGGGYAVLGYQWFHDDTPLSDGVQPDGSIITGAHSEVLSISNIGYSDQGNYRVEVTNGCGTVSSFNGTLSLDATSAPLAEARVDAFLTLGPNPSGGETMLAFSLAQDARVKFSVHDLRGRLVKQVDMGQLPAGRFATHWDARDRAGSNVAAGVYFISLEFNGRHLDAKRLTIVR